MIIKLRPGLIRKFQGYGIGIVIEEGPFKCLVVNEDSNENYIDKTTPHEHVELRPEVEKQFREIYLKYIKINVTANEIKSLEQRLKNTEQAILTDKERLRKLVKSMLPKDFEKLVVENLPEETKQIMKENHYYVKIDKNFENYYELCFKKSLTLVSPQEIKELEFPNEKYDFLFINEHGNLKMKSVTDNFCKIRNEAYENHTSTISSNNPKINSQLKEDTILKNSSKNRW